MIFCTAYDILIIVTRQNRHFCNLHNDVRTVICTIHRIFGVLTTCTYYFHVEFVITIMFALSPRGSPTS
jgi:hypothetical protein